MDSSAENAVKTQEEFNSKKRENPAGNIEAGRKRMKTLYKQPTTAELSRLRETENLFNSNLFRLQIQEVLKEVKVKEKTSKKFQVWFEKLIQYLRDVPENDKEYDLGDPQLAKELKVKIPICEETQKTKCVFKYHKSGDARIVGSYKFDCSINSNLYIDVQLTVPSETFTKNDSVNYRYHRKMAAYLAFVASHLSKTDLVADVKYAQLEGCESKPRLILTPIGKLGNNLSVRIHLVCDENSFKLARYTPSRNNVREAWFFSETEKGDIGPPTPYYNASVLQDLTDAVNRKYLEESLENGENLKQAIILLKIWLRQRHLAVSGHVITMLVAYLIQIRRINNVMSSYQIVRNVWIYIGNSDWDSKGISLFKGESKDVPSIEEFLKSFPVVFLDKTGCYNLCWRMDLGTYQSVKIESNLAISMLDSSNINSFIPLFMTTQKVNLKFDHVIRFKDVSKIKKAVYNGADKHEKLDFGLDKTQLIMKSIYDTLSRGFGSRVTLLLATKSSDFSWPVKESLKKALKNRKDVITIGLCLNPEEALNPIQKGPPANLPEAEEFRKFWGDKSELRRFQDGSITETCVWDGDTLAERRLVVKQIASYLFRFKFGITDDAFYIADQLDSVITSKEYVPADFDAGTGEEATVKLLQAFDSLRKDLRNLTDLPLFINSVYGISPVFSYSDPLPPLAHPSPPHHEHWYREKCCLIKDGDRKSPIKCPTYIKTSRAVIEFGHSGKWPGELDAFRRLKAAFNIQIADSLTKQSSLSTHAFPSHVDVLKDGYVFRLEIAHQKEINLVKRISDGGVVKYRDSEESLELEEKLVLLPRVRGAMHGLHQNHPSYGPTVSLAKRWLSSHLLDSSHFPHSVLELLVAYLFLRPEPYSPPVQPLAAFGRFLALMATTDWSTEALIVNFNGEMQREAITDVESKFSEDRSSHPPLFIVSPYDVDKRGIWSREAPTHNVLARVQMLASSALSFVEETLHNSCSDNILGVFVPSLQGYDVLIHLNTEYVPCHGEMVSKKPQLQRVKWTSEESPVIPVVDFDPVDRYLMELRAAYGDFALFFHDMYGGDVIAVLWKPDIAGEQDFQVANCNGVKPLSTKDLAKCVINTEALISDFKIIGEGLVKKVTVL